MRIARRIAIWRPRSESCCSVPAGTRHSVKASQPVDQFRPGDTTWALAGLAAAAFLGWKLLRR